MPFSHVRDSLSRCYQFVHVVRKDRPDIGVSCLFNHSTTDPMLIRNPEREKVARILRYCLTRFRF